ncbi:transglutaminase-like domain-containing protein [Agrococcus jejuensis]|uniref:Transglutaminase-like superfamily protein n=1 Tax=Agrococcus jejuensis TaxID=399736 RepID=A0A1G8AUQ3_9MICO|nr:transglutaminase-like domain-containing protein [Agrococcus jejuensis]SDH24090.1 Transglutaminase-like superfamily protein [Agrococcus jejuensis]
MTQWRLAALTTSVLAILAACLPMGALFGSTRIVPVVATALLVGTGIGLLGWWRRWPALWLILVGIAAFVVVAPPLAAPEALAGILPTFDAYGIVVPAIWQSWRDILTIAPPVGVGGGVLVAPLLLVLVGSAISSSIVLRAHRAELAGLVPVAIAAWTILFGPADPWSPVLHAVLVMSLVVVLVSIVRQARRRRAAPRTLSTLWRRSIASLTVAAAAIGCGIVGGAAMVGDRVVLRTDPVVLDTSDLDSPLSAFRASHDPDRRDETVLVATGMQQGDRLALAVLDAYDGVVAGVGDAAFVRMPAVPPTGDDVLGVAVQALEGPWLPHVGTPESVGFVGSRAAVLQASLHADADTGDLLATAGIDSGDAYEVSFSRSPVVDDLATLSPAGSPRLDVVPPADAVAWLSGWTEDATTPGERLAALVAGLAADGYLSHGVEGDPASRAGHSVARIAELFDGVMVGDGEQYAVAAALLAEQLGFPARIVVGYVPQSIVDGEPTTVVAGDLDAWVEVSTQEAGWVAIGVTPESRPIPEEESTAPQPSTQPQPPAAPVLPEGGVDRGEQPADPVQPPAQAAEDGVLRTVLGIVAATLGGMLLIASPVLVILGAKLLRRRRRRRASSRADRVEGAWKEFVDATVDRGRTRRPGATRLETARGDREVAFATAIDRALFGRVDPDDAAADAAWEAGGELVAGLDRDRSWLERLRARLSLRSLRGR